MKSSGLNCYRAWVVMHLSKEYLSNTLMSSLGIELVIFVYIYPKSKFKISRHYQWFSALSTYSSVPMANRNFVAGESSNIDKEHGRFQF